MNPFQSLGTALGKSAGGLFRKIQGQPTPNPRPVNTAGDTFDIGAGLQKLFSPIAQVFSPQAKAGGKVIEAAGRVGEVAFDALGRNVNSAIDKLFGNSNKKAENPGISNNADNRFSYPSQTLVSLSDAFKAFSAASPQVATSPAAAGAPGGINTTTWILGGFVALGAVLLLTRRSE